MKKKFFTDVVWSVMALGVMHGVLQIVVNPYLTGSMGAERFGDVLYVLAILGIFAPSVGMAANNTRLIQRNEFHVENGDYMLAMLPQLAVSTVVYMILIGPYLSGAGDYVMAFAVLCLTMLRNYGAAEYRMTLNYKGYFVYYLTISLGYLLGILLYPMTKNWMLCFLLGELFCFVLLLVRGHIYRPLRVSKNTGKVFKATLFLMGAYLLSNTVLYLDRLMLQNLMDGETVTIYYVASLLGKTAALLIGPLNGVILGHLTKGGAQMTEKQFHKGCALLVGAGVVLLGGIFVASPVFTKLFYPELYSDVMQIVWLANLSQVLCFVASPMLTIMLTFSETKWQLLIQGAYAVVFVLFGLIGVNLAGLHGFLMAGLISNGMRLLFVFCIGTMRVRKVNSVLDTKGGKR